MSMAPAPDGMADWSTITSGSMTQASTHMGASAVCAPGHAPLRSVSVVMSARMGPGMEATEKPIAYASSRLMTRA